MNKNGELISLPVRSIYSFHKQLHSLSVFVSSVFLQLFFIHESSTFYTLGYKREVYSSAFIYFVPLKSVRLHPSNVTLIL